MFNVQFVIFSSLGPAATRLISLSGASEDLLVLFLAYEAEGAGEHYYSLAGDYNAQLRACSLFVDQGIAYGLKVMLKAHALIEA